VRGELTLVLLQEVHRPRAGARLRTAALLFQIKAALGPNENKNRAWKDCATCADLLSAFEVALARGQALARARILADPADDETLFLLGKLDLNYVWLQLGTLGRRTGWDEYWEGRRALDTVLSRQPAHVRARVARGWIDYIVATKMHRGTRWLLGGGNKKRGVLAIREAAGAEADFFTRKDSPIESVGTRAMTASPVTRAAHVSRTRCDRAGCGVSPAQQQQQASDADRYAAE
jgi:hypothetical protein